MPPKPVTAIILHWNRPHECVRTVRALKGQTVPIHTFVVDNGSPPEALDMIRSEVGVDRILLLKKNLGFGPGMNSGLRDWLATGDGDWVVLAPHDALPERDCLARILNHMAERPKVGIGCAEYGEPRKPAYHFLKGPVAVSAVRGSAWEPVAFPNGTFMVFRRSCLEKIGLFDERYFAYTEEYEIALRARRAGWEVGLAWGAVVKNPIRAANSRITWYLLIRNNLLAIYQTHGVLFAGIRTLQLWISACARRIVGRTNDADHAGVRIRAICDFWLGRFGPPPFDL